MFRVRGRLLSSIHCTPVTSSKDNTGGISLVEQPNNAFSFPAKILPPQRRVTRTAAGIRLAVIWSLIPLGFPSCKEQDRIRLPGDSRVFVITAIKLFDRHAAINLELLQ